MRTVLVSWEEVQEFSLNFFENAIIRDSDSIKFSLNGNENDDDCLFLYQRSNGDIQVFELFFIINSGVAVNPMKLDAITKNFPIGGFSFSDNSFSFRQILIVDELTAETLYSNIAHMVDACRELIKIRKFK